jgi:2-dehydropantoate 2-reductase
VTIGGDPILVVGAGAIGGYLGARLSVAGYRVALLTRPPAAEQINAEGLRLTEAGATTECRVPAFSEAEAAVIAGGAPGLVVLAMKGYDLSAALAPLTGLAASSLFLTTQNGIGIEEIVAGTFGEGRVLSAAVTIPIRKVSPANLVVEKSGRGLGLAAVAPGNDRLPHCAGMLAKAGLKVELLPDYRAMKWSKAFLNIMGNATSAILGMPPADIVRDRAGYELEIGMLREMLAVMDRAGLHLVNLPGAGVTPLAQAVRYLPRLILRGLMEQVARRGRGDKMPSFYLDLQSGIGKSEVVFHNGAIAAAGLRYGVPTPINATLNDVLLALTDGRRDPAEFAGQPGRLLAEATARHPSA